MSFVTMTTMMKQLTIIFLILLITIPMQVDASTGELLSRINDLRGSVGLSGYTINNALTAAANNHAAWMVNTGNVSHTQDNGSGPRTRAQNAGYSSNFVSENIYMGSDSSISSAWTFWVNSPIHYAGMTSPNYNNIGIGTAAGANGYAFVLVFGNSSGSLPRSINTSNNAGGQGGDQAVVVPSFVVGIDGIGNIMHEVQPGDTIGDIALIYGYTWEDVPYMLGVNGLSEDDVTSLEIGSVFLVPPQDGTYTPSPAPPTSTPSATHTPTVPPQTATEMMVATQMIAPVTFVMPSQTPTEAVVVRSMPTLTPTSTPSASPLTEASEQTDTSPVQTLLIIALVVQVGVIGIATFEFFRRSR